MLRNEDCYSFGISLPFQNMTQTARSTTEGSVRATRTVNQKLPVPQFRMAGIIRMQRATRTVS